MTDTLQPKDHAEAVALFRAQVLGPLLCRDGLPHGERTEALRELSQTAVRPPGSAVSRCYAVPTLERWLYAYRRGGLTALAPRPRSDRGAARALNAEQRQLLLDIRTEHPRASAALILRTLEVDGRLPRGLVSASTLRRLYRAEGLDRLSLGQRSRSARRRWQAPRPNAVWHADVCHGPALRVEGRAVPLRVHAILDDHSRFVVAIQACATERESEMLALLVKAVRLYGLPEMLYLDNGPTYSGDALRTVCGRLGITLLHAKPHDPEARGKMERFWRTMQEQCVQHLGPMSSLHDVQVRLLAWLDLHYLASPHAALLGRCPAHAYDQDRPEPDLVDETVLREALTLRAQRRILRDGTVGIAGTVFEVEQGYLAGRNVTVARSLLDPTKPPWIEHEEQRVALHPVDPVANATRRRSRRTRRGIDAVPFDPPGALLAQLTKGGAR